MPGPLRRATVALVCGAVLLAGCSAQAAPMRNPDDAPFVLTSVTGVEQIAPLTGADSASRTDQYGVYGTDLGSMFEFDGKMWFVFGDTFGERDADQVGGGGSFWRSNTLGFTTDFDPRDGITLDGMIVDDGNSAMELLPSKKIDNDEMTVIPTHGFAVGDTMYLHWMSVRHWGVPGEWEVNDAGLAKSSDTGQTWEVLDSPRWDGESDFVQVSPAHVTDDGTDWLYFWGTTHGRFGGVSLARVEATKVEDSSAWEYFAGDTENWSDSVDDASLVIDDTVGELSVVWNDYLDRWIMTYLRDGDGVVMREGINPWGPWGDPITLISPSDVPGLYAPFMSERYTTDGGKTIYFGLSIWDPYNVYWYKAELSKD